jgi:hypothetical protein
VAKLAWGGLREEIHRMAGAHGGGAALEGWRWRRRRLDALTRRVGPLRLFLF